MLKYVCGMAFDFISKNRTIPMNQFEKKWKNLIFEGIKGG